MSAPASTAATKALGSTDETQTCNKRNDSIKAVILHTNHYLIFILIVSTKKVQSAMWKVIWDGTLCYRTTLTGREVKLMASFTSSGLQAISTWVAPPCIFFSSITHPRHKLSRNNIHVKQDRVGAIAGRHCRVLNSTDFICFFLLK